MGLELKKMKMASFLLRRCQFYSIAFQFHFHWKKRLVKWFAFRGDEKPKKKQTNPKKNQKQKKSGAPTACHAWPPAEQRRSLSAAASRRRSVTRRRRADNGATGRVRRRRRLFPSALLLFFVFVVVLRVLRRSVFGRPKKILKNQVETTIFFQNEDVDEFDAHFFFISLIKNLKKRTKNDSALVPTMNRL